MGEVFRAEAAFSSGGPATYTWNFGDGVYMSGTNLTLVTHAYTTVPANSYTPSVTVTNGTETVTKSWQLAVINLAPTVSAGPAKRVFASSSVTFAGEMSDPNGAIDLASIQWDFDYDGLSFKANSSGNGTFTPSYTYASPGLHIAALKVTDLGGNSTIHSTTVLVKPQGTILATAGPDAEVVPGQSHSFSGSFSAPGLSVPTSGIAWDFNYNGQVFNAQSTGTLTPSRTFALPGTYTVALRVADNTSKSDLSILTIEARYNYTGPTATAGTDLTINEGASVTFAGSYTDPDGTVASSGIEWDFNYNDANEFEAESTGTLTPTRQFQHAGPYQVALRVTDNHGLSHIHVIDVTVENVAPTVSAGADQTLAAGTTTTFAGTFTDPGDPDEQFSFAWDFDYDGTEFVPSLANAQSAYRTFNTPGTYTVAFRVTDGNGESSIDTLQVVINSATTPVLVNAGSDSAIDEGDSITFAGSYSVASGSSVVVQNIDWDFDYDGVSFDANSSASGTLTPTRTFATPGQYLVALRIQGLNGSTPTTWIGTMYVQVASLAPVVDPGDAPDVEEGELAGFSATASDPGGIVSIAWDFDYDYVTFQAESSGSLTPTHTFDTAGVYTVALRAIDNEGTETIETMFVTVDNVAQAATLAAPTSVNEGQPATFTFSNLEDATTSYYFEADWTGAGEFTWLVEGESFSYNQNNTISVWHTYDDGTGQTYPVTIRLIDEQGGATNFTRNLTITNQGPMASFGPSGGLASIGAGVPIRFSSVLDPSFADQDAGFTYFVSVDGGAYTSSTNPAYLLPSYAPGSHVVSGYVQDKDGGTSPVYTTNITVSTVNQQIRNTGSGTILVSWSGGSASVGPNTTYNFGGVATGLSITLATTQASYDISTNGSIASVQPAAGVESVLLWLNTGVTNLGSFVGTGDIGSVTLPQGTPPPEFPDPEFPVVVVPTNLNLFARGDLGSITGAARAHATDVAFENLTGSITALDYVGTLTARSWLGDDSTDQVWARTGIGTLSAYGIKGSVQPAREYPMQGSALNATIGRGGINRLDADRVATLTSQGNVAQLSIQWLTGSVQLTRLRGVIDQLFIGYASPGAEVESATGAVKHLLLGSKQAQAVLTKLAVQLTTVIQKPEAPKPTAFTAAFREYGKSWDLNKNGSITDGEINILMARRGEEKEIKGEQAAALATFKKFRQALLDAFGNKWPDTYDTAIATPSSKRHDTATKIEEVHATILAQIKATPKDIPFVNNPSTVSIKQGMVGDCALVAAVLSRVAIAERNNSFTKITDMIESTTHNNQPAFKVTFPGADKPVVVIPPTESEIGYFASAGKNGLWLTLLEKGYAQIREGSSFRDYLNEPQRRFKFIPARNKLIQEEINGEFVATPFKLLTGTEPTTLLNRKREGLERFNDFFLGQDMKYGQSPKAIGKAIEDAIKDGRLITAMVPSTKDFQGKELPGPHAYAIVGYEDGKVTVHNPHNSTKYEFGAKFPVANMDAFVKLFEYVTIEPKK